MKVTPIVKNIGLVNNSFRFFFFTSYPFNVLFLRTDVQKFSFFPLAFTQASSFLIVLHFSCFIIRQDRVMSGDTSLREGLRFSVNNVTWEKSVTGYEYPCINAWRYSTKELVIHSHTEFFPLKLILYEGLVLPVLDNLYFCSFPSACLLGISLHTSSGGQDEQRLGKR